MNLDGSPQLRLYVPDTQLPAVPADISGGVASDCTSPAIQILPVDASGAYQVPRKIQNIMNVNITKTTQSRHYLLHQPLEGGRGIAEAKGHDTKLEQAFKSNKCYHLLRLCTDRDLPVSSLSVKHGENTLPLKLIKQVVNTWEKKYILFGNDVQSSVIYTETWTTILLTNYDYRASPRTR